MDRVGVFGSTFNPPHIGHLILVAEARWRLRLDRVIAVPTGDPYHKETALLPAPETRLALAKAAFKGQPDVTVSSIEVERPGPTFTVDTLEAIVSEHPESSIRLLLGSDSALKIGEWHRPERIFELARIAVAPRDLLERDRVERAVAAAGGLGLVDFFAMPQVAVSSTLVRERIRAGEPYRHLVPTAVASIIENERLYAA